MAFPQGYKVMAELPGARLVEMTLGPGEEDIVHDHPVHSMYVIDGGKLSITDYKDGKPMEPHVVDIPSGAPPIMPAGVHQVKNVGDTKVKIVFVEAFPSCAPCGPLGGAETPFKVSPECYTSLAENDDWITGLLTMEPGQKDAFHYHRDHLIYVLSGNNITINVGGDESNAIVKDIAPFHGLPAPMAAPPFASHSLINSGTETLKMVFFEMKK